MEIVIDLMTQSRILEMQVLLMSVTSLENMVMSVLYLPYASIISALRAVCSEQYVRVCSPGGFTALCFSQIGCE